MADDSRNDAEVNAAKAAPVKKKSKLVLIIALVLAVGAGGAGSYFFLKPAASAKADTKKSKTAKADAGDDDSDQQTDEAADGEKTGGEKDKTGKDDKSKSGVSALMLPKDKEVKKVIDLQPFTLNLADKEENRFLRLSVELGISEESEEKPDPVFITRVRNAVLAVLMTKTSAEVLSAEGKATLRKELLQAIRAAAEEPRVIAIYITELIVQR